MSSRFRIAERGPGRWPDRRSAYPSSMWTVAREPYPGAIALDDLELCPGDIPGCTRVLARFAALRVALLAAGGAGVRMLDRERNAARPYVEALPPGAEADTLTELLAAAVPEPGRVLVMALRGAAAVASPHPAGAYALLRAAWAISVARRWDAIAAAAALDIAQLARETGHPHEAEPWERRAAESTRRT